MWVDWDNTQVHIRASGKFLSKKGVAHDDTWKFWMFCQSFWYIWSGRATIELPRGKVPLKPGMCLWLRPGFEYKHVQNPDDPLGVYCIYFDLLMPDDQLRSSAAPLPYELLSVPEPKFAAMVVERLAAVSPESGVWGRAMSAMERRRLQYLFTSLLMELDEVTTSGGALHRAPPHIARINELHRRIEEDPTQFESVEAMAREMGYTTSHFCRLFKKLRAFSPQRALILSRVRHAARLLLETDLPIKAIAEQLDYHDVYYFTRQFKQCVGKAPGRYRKTAPRGPVKPPQR